MLISEAFTVTALKMLDSDLTQVLHHYFHVQCMQWWLLNQWRINWLFPHCLQAHLDSVLLKTGTRPKSKACFCTWSKYCNRAEYCKHARRVSGTSLHFTKQLLLQEGSWCSPEKGPPPWQQTIPISSCPLSRLPSRQQRTWQHFRECERNLSCSSSKNLDA